MRGRALYNHIREIAFERPRVALSLAIGAALLVTGTFSVAPVVRWRAHAAAARRGFAVDIGEVHVRWFAVELIDVHATSLGSPLLSVDLTRVRVALGAFGGVTGVSVIGGAVIANGSVESLRELLQARGAANGGESRNRFPISAEAVSVTWRSSSEEGAPRLEVLGVSAHRSPQRLEISLESGEMAFRYGAISLHDASAVFSNGELAELRAKRADVTAAAPAMTSAALPEAAAATAPPASASPLIPPPLPPLLPAAGSRTRGAPSVANPSPGEQALPVFPLPDLHALRARIAKVGTAAALRLPAGAKIEIEELTLKAGTGAHLVALGPGRLEGEREGGRCRLTFATKADGSGAPVVFRAELPLADGPVIASFEGGPVSLALLENAGGIARGKAPGASAGKSTTLVGAASATLDASGAKLRVDANIRVQGLVIDHPALASNPVRDLDVAVVGSAELDDQGLLTLHHGEVAVDALRVVASGTLEQKSDHAAAAFSFEVPASSCQSMLESVPTALFPTVHGTRVRGTFGATGRISFDSRALDALVLQYAFADRCAFTDVPRDLSKERFSAAFVHTVYEPDGTLGERTTGPGTASWSDLDSISPFMEIAVMTTEDGAFLHHKGFNHGAIRGALIADLKAHKFIRGASTISMQLAKNVFLGREKTLSRKLEEVVLTDYLEQAFEKREILELYLNVIEFGPGLYGITDAAEHYFGRTPGELNLAESLFLASLLPAPLRYHHMFERGEVPAGWLKHVRQLMEISARVGLITKAELAEGQGEEIIFRKQGDPHPTPRAPAAPERRHRNPDSDWQEIDDE